MKLPSLSTTLLLTSLALWPNKMAWAEGDTSKVTPPECTSLTATIQKKTFTALNTGILGGISEQNKEKVESAFLETMGHKFNKEEAGKFIIKLLRQADTQTTNHTGHEKDAQYSTADLILTLLVWLGWGLGITKLGGSKKEDETDTLFEKISTSLPVPMVRYSKEGSPLIWNKYMEEETGYSHAEVIAYFKKKEEVMTLLYKWENLERVQQYLAQIAAGWQGYENVTFTMTTKSWEEKTFLWTTFPDGNGGTVRIARHLTDIKEILGELAKTQERLRRCPKTDAYNDAALTEDMGKLFSHNWRRKDPVSMALLFVDVDKFKSINSICGHAGADVILKQLVVFLQEHTREGDRVYRFWGDEFIILMEIDDIRQIINNMGAIRRNFYDIEFPGSIHVWTSWWVVPFNTGDHIKYDAEGKSTGLSQSEIHNIITQLKEEADRYMYAVKDFHYIHDDLVRQNKIQQGQVPKNGIAIPQYTKDRELLWVDVFSDNAPFFITSDELGVIEHRKLAEEEEENKPGAMH